MSRGERIHDGFEWPKATHLLISHADAMYIPTKLATQRLSVQNGARTTVSPLSAFPTDPGAVCQYYAGMTSYFLPNHVEYTSFESERPFIDL